MGVRRGQYARELEKKISKGKSLRRAHKGAAAISSVTRKVDKYDRPSLAERALYKVAQVQTAYRKLRRKKK